MHRNDEEGPVYYREIQKNAYLKRLPTEQGSKLLPLVHKKQPLKPMWTLLCVHNGRTPYLEQYPEAESAETLAHRPVWRVCLDSARHVTTSVAPYTGREHDFLIDTDRGAVRMLAPDWATMQDWVTTLRSKLAELKIVSKGENVYCAPPVVPTPRAGTRDPTSPLPAPPAPPPRVPGIELPESNIPPANTIEVQPEQVEPEQVEADQEHEQNENTDHEEQRVQTEDVDISQWDSNLDLTQPSTSVETKKAVKICGQNIALDDSILKRDSTQNDEFDIDSVTSDSESIRDVNFGDGCDFKQSVLIGGESGAKEGECGSSKFQGTNITVIQVSNKAPHTAIPVLGSDTDVFDFEFKQKLTIDDRNDTHNDFVNIVHTENGYGTVFDSKESDYGHLSLTTTVNLAGVTENGVYERLCMASTSNDLRKVKNAEKSRKSSLPNLECKNSTYEYIFPGNTVTQTVLTGNTNNANISVVSTRTENNARIENSARTENNTRTELNNSRTELRPDQTIVRPEQVNVRTEQGSVRPEQTTVRPEHNSGLQRRRELTNTISVGSSNLDSNTRVREVNVERSHSQSSYDNVRTNRKLYSSPKRDGKIEKELTQHKPIWRRGLTELSLLTRLKGITQRDKKQETQDSERTLTSPAKVVHRSRPDARVDSGRRRSSSLSDEPRIRRPPQPSLRTREALCLRAEQARGAAADVAVSYLHIPVMADYKNAVWIAHWGLGGSRAHGRCGDRVAAVRGTRPKDAAHAKQLARGRPGHPLNILFHRVPLGKIFVLNKNSDSESLGIRIDSECNVLSVAPNSAAARASLPTAGWAVTEVNNRPINLIKGGEDDLIRLSQYGREVTVLLQPSPLIKKLRAAIKANKSVLGIR